MGITAVQDAGSPGCNQLTIMGAFDADVKTPLNKEEEGKNSEIKFESNWMLGVRTNEV